MKKKFFIVLFFLHIFLVLFLQTVPYHNNEKSVKGLKCTFMLRLHVQSNEAVDGTKGRRSLDHTPHPSARNIV